MAINRDFLNHTFPASEPYEISRVKIREFADAIGDPSPVFRDPAAAQAAGYPDVIAPPTFPIVITAAAGNRAATDPELGINYEVPDLHPADLIRIRRRERAAEEVPVDGHGRPGR